MKPLIPRQRNYLSALPERVRLKINCKLRDGWRHRAVSEWLLTQSADRDIPEHLLKKGDPYAFIWSRNARDENTARENCRTTISHWFRGPYRDWLAQQPKPVVPFGAPRAIKIAFRALTEEIKDNPKALKALRRLRDAVRSAVVGRVPSRGGSPSL